MFFRIKNDQHWNVAVKQKKQNEKLASKKKIIHQEYVYIFLGSFSKKNDLEFPNFFQYSFYSITDITLMIDQSIEFFFKISWKTNKKYRSYAIHWHYDQYLFFFGTNIGRKNINIYWCCCCYGYFLDIHELPN